MAPRLWCRLLPLLLLAPAVVGHSDSDSFPTAADIVLPPPHAWSHAPLAPNPDPDPDPDPYLTTPEPESARLRPSRSVRARRSEAIAQPLAAANATFWRYFADLLSLATRDSAPALFAVNASVAQCREGRLTTEHQQAVVSRINAYRWFCGVEPVFLDLQKSTSCQLLALVLSANRMLTHDLAPDAACYSREAKNAAHSANIALNVHGAAAIDAYLDDFGPQNTRVGHRRWLLYSGLRSVGVGDIVSPLHSDANAVWVFDPSITSPSVQRVMAWPSAGFFPFPLLPSSRRFSISLQHADFSFATVTVTNNGLALPLSAVVADPFYGDPALTFEVPSLPALAAGDEPNRLDVAVTNVILGRQVISFNYSTTLFDPSGLRLPLAGRQQRWSPLLLRTRAVNRVVHAR
jgi:hypothetical protein